MTKGFLCICKQQFSRDSDEIFQLLFPWPEDDHILSRSCSTDFYLRYGP